MGGAGVLPVVGEGKAGRGFALTGTQGETAGLALTTGRVGRLPVGAADQHWAPVPRGNIWDVSGCQPN